MCIIVHSWCSLTKDQKELNPAEYRKLNKHHYTVASNNTTALMRPDRSKQCSLSAVTNLRICIMYIKKLTAKVPLLYIWQNNLDLLKIESNGLIRSYANSPTHF